MRTEPFNKLTDAEDELLAMMSEECAEIIQVIGKIQRHGLRSKNPVVSTGTNLEMLEREMGDLLSVFRLSYQMLTSPENIAKKARHKLDRIDKYVHAPKLLSVIRTVREEAERSDDLKYLADCTVGAISFIAETRAK